MTFAPSCPHEAEVLEIAALGRWPEFAEPALRTHAADCATCGELARVAMGIAAWQDVSLSTVRLPDASHVWREAERRARSDATRRATRPVLAVELAALAVALLLMATWGPALWAVASGVLEGFVPSEGLWPAQVWTGLAGLWSADVASDTQGWSSSAGSTVRWSVLTVAAWAVLVSLALSLAGLADRTSDPESGHSKPAR
jgi:hypothetical protein